MKEDIHRCHRGSVMTSEKKGVYDMEYICLPLSFATLHNAFERMSIKYEPPHDKTKEMAWSESSLSAWRKLRSLATHWAHSKDWSDWVDAQANLSLRWAHSHFVGFVIWFCTVHSNCSLGVQPIRAQISCKFWVFFHDIFTNRSVNGQNDLFIWASSPENLSFDQVRLKLACAATEAS